MTTTDTTAEPVLRLVDSPEERMMRETVAPSARASAPRTCGSKAAAGEPPTELWDALASRGFLGVNLPEEYGGGGLGMSALAAVGEEISAAGCSLLLIVVSPAIVGSILARHGTPDQKDALAAGDRRGHDKVAFAITEPEPGSNSHNLATSRERRTAAT